MAQKHLRPKKKGDIKSPLILTGFLVPSKRDHLRARARIELFVPSVIPSFDVDFDGKGFRLRQLFDPDCQNPVFHVGGDLFGVGILGKGE